LLLAWSRLHIEVVTALTLVLCAGSHGFCLLNNLAIGAAYAMNVHRWVACHAVELPVLAQLCFLLPTI
jgi:hypothetical protein